MLVVLLQDISFTDLDNKPVFIAQGSQVYVDTEESIAYHNGLHFDIDKTEYASLN
jgi:hypothetical protein